MPSITIGCSGFAHAGLGGIGGGEEPVRAAVLLKIGDLVVGQLDVVLALPRLQLCGCECRSMTMCVCTSDELKMVTRL